MYCQYLLVSQINYTCTNLAEHVEGLDHNSVYRYLKSEKLTPRLVWEHAQETLVMSNQGCIIFDDTVADKDYSYEIAGVRKQYSGNAHGLVKGIGIVTFVYYNPELDRYWVIDYRIFDPDRDGKTKLDHVNEMLSLAEKRGVRYKTALMDSWYATTQMMTRLHQAGKLFYCPLKHNRLVDESKGQQPYQAVETLVWSEGEDRQGKVVKVKGFAKTFYLKLFRVIVSTDKTDFFQVLKSASTSLQILTRILVPEIVTNDLTQDDTEATQQESSHRWKIEQFHREAKQLTGLEHCQCRLNRSQRNHICASLLVWSCLSDLAHQTQQTLYSLKHGLLADYLKQQLRQPSLTFS
jgi:Transposase DDE domain